MDVCDKIRCMELFDAYVHTSIYRYNYILKQWKFMSCLNGQYTGLKTIKKQTRCNNSGARIF